MQSTWQEIGLPSTIGQLQPIKSTIGECRAHWYIKLLITSNILIREVAKAFK